MKPTTITVRPATVSDAAGIARVHVAAWRFAYRGKLPQSFLDSLSVESRTRTWRQGISNPVPHSGNIVAVMNDQVIGFCSYGPSRDTGAAGSRAELFAIYVDPLKMRRGIGSLLMNACLDKLKQQRFCDVTLWVLDSNETGRRFYEQYGWTDEGTTRMDHIGDADVEEVRYYLDLSSR